MPLALTGREGTEAAESGSSGNRILSDSDNFIPLTRGWECVTASDHYYVTDRNDMDRYREPTVCLPAQARDFLAHACGLWRIWMLVEKVAQCGECRGPVAAPEVNLGKYQLWMGEVRRVWTDSDFQVLLCQVQIVQVEVREPELRVGERIVRPAHDGALVVSDRLPRSPEIQQHAAQIDQGFEGFRIDIERSAEVRLRFAVPARLISNRTQLIPRGYEQFSPGFFDLLVFDEAHRSIFNRMNEVMEYFDARMIGLAATPAGFIERDTFRVFHCDGKTPTALYTYADAVLAGHLVDFSRYQANTSFQRDGIKGVDLSEEDQNALIEQGIDPDDIDYSGTDIERTVSNRNTLVRQWEEFMDVCIKDQSGQLPGKSIVFAMTQPHAQRLRLVFEQMYPQYKDLVEVITSDTERVRDGSYEDGLITKFKKNDMPRIAISVDMLDKGREGRCRARHVRKR